MREPPAGMANEQLIAALAEQYGLKVVELRFLPLGYDASAWVYRAEAADGTAYFVKLRTSVTNLAALLVPQYLHEHGVNQVVAPLATTAGKLWATAGAFGLIIYPFVEGRSGVEQGMNQAQWRAYGATLRQIHDTPIGAGLAWQLRRDSFVPAEADTIRRLDASLAAGQFEHAEAAALAEHWQAHRSTIHLLLEQAEELGRQLAHSPPPALLCHADIHTYNLLIDHAQQVWVIDWDETLLAPRERDLMFVAGGGISRRLIGPQQEAWFFAGYGPVALDQQALDFYRAAWAVSDIGAFGAQVCFRPDLGPFTRQEGVRAFASLFEPGEIVEIAGGD